MNKKTINSCLDDKMIEQEQIDEWSKLYGRQITEEEYKEICDNHKASYLRKWNYEK